MIGVVYHHDFALKFTLIKRSIAIGTLHEVASAIPVIETPHSDWSSIVHHVLHGLTLPLRDLVPVTVCKQVPTSCLSQGKDSAWRAWMNKIRWLIDRYAFLRLKS